NWPVHSNISSMRGRTPSGSSTKPRQCGNQMTSPRQCGNQMTSPHQCGNQMTTPHQCMLTINHNKTTWTINNQISTPQPISHNSRLCWKHQKTPHWLMNNLVFL